MALLYKSSVYLLLKGPRPIFSINSISSSRFKYYQSTMDSHSDTSEKMSSQRRLAAEMLKRRVDKSDKKRYTLNLADIQVIGNCYQGFTPSLIVTSERNSYLFNCGEGTQRFCYSNQIKLASIENVFSTSLDWGRVSGVYGLALTLQDLGIPYINVHSTEGISNLFRAAKTFIQFNTGMQYSTKTPADGVYSDSSIRIQPIVLDADTQRVDHPSHDDDEPVQSSKRTKVASKVVAYLCSFPDLPGRLDPDKCRELKIPVGRLLGVLKSGRDVVLPNKRVVRSADVCGPRDSGVTFLVIECPSENYIENLLTNTQLDEIRKFRKSRQEKEIEMVVHFSPTSVTENPKYKSWMKGFAENCKHLLLFNSQPKTLDFIDCYRHQYLLNQLDSAIFPSLYLPPNLDAKIQAEMARPPPTDYLKEDWSSDIDYVKIEYDSLPTVIQANSMDKFNFRPHKVLETPVGGFEIDALYKDAKILPYFEEELAELKKMQETMPKTNDYEPEIVFLGTVSAIPSKFRNTSCILINFHHNDNISIMMDCGESSYAQMSRLYGPQKTAEILKRLKMIYVSHHHTDHHIGLIQILRERRKLTDEPILLLLPPGVDILLNYHDQNFEDLSDSYQVYSTRALRTKPSESWLDCSTANTVKSDLYEKLGNFLKDITVVDVDHCMNSCAVVMSFKIGHPDMDSFTVAYSGDARPSEEFVLAGRDCDVLIHEATCDFRSQEDALLKKHSTSSEAIQVGKQMGAKFTILTHFSSRIPKIPYFNKDFDDKVGFAFDNLSLRCPSHYGRLPILKSILSLVFKKSIDETDLKFLRQEEKLKSIKKILEAQQ